MKKTDARGVVTTMNYDSLNRILTKSYSDGTPGVGYLYDTDVSATDASSLFHGEEGVRWDGAGRAVASRRVSAVSGQKDSVATSYASSIGYAAHGALASMTLGNGLQESWDYSAKRLQARRVRVGTTGEWQFSYCAGSYTAECAQNNGNVLSEVILPLNATQTFTYDPLSRLKTFVDSGGPRQTYVYDRYGNRALIGGTANGNYVPAAPPTPQVTNDDAAQAAAIFAGNRWVGSTADAAGNLTQPATGAYPRLTFDAENRITSAVTGSTASETYSYDGEGRRVKKVSGNVRTVYVYSADGKLAAEYATVAPAESGTRYLTVDHLGSTRLVTGTGGVVDKRYDYLPFGQEMVAGVGGRTTALRYQDGSAADGQRVRFTGKERDAETGLDYVGARYMSSAQGRFIRPDPNNPILNAQMLTAGGLPSEAARAHLDHFLENTQDWNRYAYVRNNPLTLVDPFGAAPVGGFGQHLFPERSRYIGLAKEFTNAIFSGGPNVYPNDGFRSEHRAYNVAVEELLQGLEQEFGAARNSWTLSQWKEAATRTLNSDVRAIRWFLDAFNKNQGGKAIPALAAAIEAYRPSAALVASTAAESLLNLLRMPLIIIVNPAITNPQKRIQEEIKKDHKNCLLDRKTGNCVF